MTQGSAGAATIQVDLADVQGNLVGFNKDHQRLLFVSFPDQATGRAFVGQMAQEVNHAAEVKEFNRRYKQLVERGEDPLTIQASWVNLNLTFAGLQQLGADRARRLPTGVQSRHEGPGVDPR